MKVLWDFRLFSYGYSNRGVGIFTQALAYQIIRTGLKDRIYIWGDRNCVPQALQSVAAKWIPYKSGNWKKDFLHIPFLIFRYQIDIFQYWIALGPLWKIGMGAFHPCRTIATIYDMGVEFWDVPFLMSVKQSLYWSIQKRLAKTIDKAICISRATEYDLARVIPSLSGKSHVIYMPFEETTFKIVPREHYFITLGGSIHKNCARVVRAFSSLRRKYPDYKLLILGDVDKSEESLQCVPDCVSFETMGQYSYHLQHSSGLLFCSLNEGLGIPPLEAMACNCPVVASQIPSLKEICTNAARFVNPLEIQSISEGIEDLIKNNSNWVQRSHQGGDRYREMCSRSGVQCLQIYEETRSTKHETGSTKLET